MVFQEGNRPGGELPEWQLFEKKVHEVDGKQKVVGFNSPDGKYYPLEDGEELVGIRENDGEEIKAFIKKDGHKVPFEEWKEGK
jgi:hypothetical protein